MGADPVSWAMLASVVGSQVAGQMSANKAADQAEEAQRRKAEAARKAAEADAAGVRKRTRLARQADEADFRRRMSGARVGLAKGGVSAGGGSALEMLGSATAQHGKNLLDLEARGEAEARKAQNAGSYGSGVRSAPSTARDVFDVADTLLSLGSRAYKLYKN